jgi:hypothetical protein
LFPECHPECDALLQRDRQTKDLKEKKKQDAVRVQ